MYCTCTYLVSTILYLTYANRFRRLQWAPINTKPIFDGDLTHTAGQGLTSLKILHYREQSIYGQQHWQASMCVIYWLQYVPINDKPIFDGRPITYFIQRRTANLWLACKQVSWTCLVHASSFGMLRCVPMNMVDRTHTLQKAEQRNSKITFKMCCVVKCRPCFESCWDTSCFKFAAYISYLIFLWIIHVLDSGGFIYVFRVGRRI